MIKTILLFPYFLYACCWLIVLLLLSFPITLILLLFPEKIKDYGMFWLLKVISNAWFILCGMIPYNYNRRKIDVTKSYIITPNHQSFLDAAIVYTSIPHLFKTLGKKEIEKIPIYGIIYKTVVITVDRSSMTAKAASFRRMKKELEEGISIVLFSEGTFTNEPQEQLNPFQIGGYSLAIMQQADILPILYLDTARRLHPSKLLQITPGMNRAVFLPPLSASNVQKQDAERLKNYAQHYMQSCLDFSRTNQKKEIWNYALSWLQLNPFV